jgi:predicted amidohydrolase
VLLKRGDIAAHIYALGKSGILDGKGVLCSEVTAVRRRGGIFGFGSGVADVAG